MVLGHLAAVSGATLLLLVHVALGARIRRALGGGASADALWRWPVDAALGGGALAMLLLALGATRLLQPVSVLTVTALVAVLARRELIDVGTELGARLIPPRTPPSDLAASGVGAVLRALVAVLVLLLVAAAVAPPTEWDSLMYHLRIPLAFLDDARIAAPRDSFHVALVGSAHLATLPLLAAGIEVGPALMQVAAFVLVLMGTAALARAVGVTRSGGWLAVAVLVGCPAFALVAVTARVDVSLVLALLAAHLALVSATVPEDRGALLVAALLIGVAMAIKPQAGAYAIALAPLGWRAAKGMKPALAAAAVAAVVAAPWYLKNQILAGAPLYPIGAPGWFEPWIADLFGTRVRPPEVDASVLRALPEARASFRVFDAFFAPGELTIEAEGAFYALSPMLLALPLLALSWRTRARAAGAGAVAVVYALLVVVPFGRINLRYLMPMVPALAVAAAAAIEAAGDWLGTRVSAGMRRALWAVALVSAMLPITGAVRQRFLSGQVVLLRHALGIASANEVWRNHPDGTSRELSPTIANIRRLVPPNGRVLMLWEARGLPFEREVLVDVMLSNWSYVGQSPAFSTCLAGTGITHLLVNAGAVEYYVNRGADARAFMLDRFANFRERCLTGHRTIGPGVEFFQLSPRTSREDQIRP